MQIKVQVFYDTHFGSITMTERVVKIFKIISGVNPNQVLDIGCGDGYLLWRLNQSGIMGRGIDISDVAVDLCIKRGISAVQVNIDQNDLPFSDNAFDLVVCGEVIEHLFDPDHLLDEIHRVLSPNGYLILTTPNLGWWLNRIVLLLGYQPYYTEVSSHYNLGKLRKGADSVNGHIRSFTYPALKELVILHNFSIVKKFGTHEPMMTNPFVKRIDKQLSKNTSIACNMGIVCQKLA